MEWHLLRCFWMSTHPEPSIPNDGSSSDSAPLSTERRKLLRGSLAAGPVLMTVLSRPVLASDCLNVTVQASLMAGTSLHPGCPGVNISTGLSPSRWCSNTASWPSPYCATNSSGQSSTSGTLGYSANTLSPTQTATLFHSPTTGFDGTVFGSHTLLSVLKEDAGGAGYGTVGMYIAAALLNSASGRTPFLSQATVRQMWNDLLLQGYYEPTAGMHWGATQIVSYLQSTMH